MNIVTFVRKISNEYDILRTKFDILHTIYVDKKLRACCL